MKLYINKESITRFLIGLICIYNISTLLQTYNSFYITAAVVCILIFSIVTNKRVDQKMFVSSVGCLGVSLLVIMCVFMIKGKPISEAINYFSLIWGMFYCSIFTDFLLKNDNKKAVQSFITIQLIVIIISAAVTLYFLKTNPLVARAIGGVGSGEEDVDLLKRLGCGGYSFVYGAVAVCYAMMIRVKEKKGNRIFNLMVLFALMALIFSSNYSTAILITLFTILYVFIIPKNNGKWFFALVILMLVIVVFWNDILGFLFDMANKTGLFFVADKMNSLLAGSTGSFNSLSRYRTFMISINSFASNPLVGGDISSGHSVLLDMLADIGIFVVIPILMMLRMFRYYCLSMEEKYYIGFLIITLAIMLVNTFYGPAQIISYFLITPLIIGIMNQDLEN